MVYFITKDGKDKRNAYGYPKEYQRTVDILNKETEEHGKFFDTVPHVLYFAATVAVSKGLGEIDNDKKQDVYFGGFNNAELDYQEALITFLYKKQNPEILKIDNDEELHNTFLRLSASGLKYLDNELFNSSNTDLSPLKLITDELKSAFAIYNK